MISNPDLLFKKGIEVIAEEEPLKLSYLIETKERDKRLLASSTDKDVIRQLNKELIEGFSPNVQTFKPIAFPINFGLDVLVRDFLRPKYSDYYLFHALGRAPVDLPTIQYRWEVLDELLEDRKKLKQLGEITDQLANVFALLNKRYKDFWFESTTRRSISCKRFNELLDIDLNILNQYVESISALEKILQNSSSSGLASLYEYATKVIATGQFKLISEMVDNYFNAHYVELGVTIDTRNNVKGVKYLAVGQNKMKRGFFRRVIAELKRRNLSIILNNRITMSYENLLAIVFDGVVEESIKQIKATTKLVGDIEFYASAVRFRDILLANNLPAERPEFRQIECRTHDIEDMYHPMMNYSVDFRGNIKITKIIPNSFHATPESNILMVTGINNGGKTRYTTGVGLVFALGQSCYYVPTKSAKLSLVDNIFTHFVSEDETKKEGRWVNEIVRIKDSLNKMTPYSVSFIDDFGSGTNYVEARIPALNVIYGHYRLGTTLLMNSHLHQLTLDIEDFPTASNWQVEAEETQKGVNYTYRIIPGKAGRSFAQRIAESYGLSKSGIDRMIAERIKNRELPETLIKPQSELKYK